jgi:hypothetical protein
MSALPPEADIYEEDGHVRFLPQKQTWLAAPWLTSWA